MSDIFILICQQDKMSSGKKSRSLWVINTGTVQLICQINNVNWIYCFRYSYCIALFYNIIISDEKTCMNTFLITKATHLHSCMSHQNSYNVPLMCILHISGYVDYNQGFLQWCVILITQYHVKLYIIYSSISGDDTAHYKLKPLFTFSIL